MSASDQKDLLLVDSRHLLWRAASVFFDLVIEDDDGNRKLTGGVYGFLRILLSSWRQFGGTVVACWDRHEGPVNRRAIDPAYKNKPPPPEGTKASHYRSERQQMISDMMDQEATVKRILSLLGIRQASSPGWEADDTIATFCRRFGETQQVGILSGDRDLLQLVTNNVMLIRPMPKGEFLRCTPENVVQDHGVTPKQILDLKALAGDDGDNVPGAKGIGPKTAAKLIQEHGTWEKCLTWASTTLAVSKTQSILVRDADQIRLSAKLVALNDRAPLEFIDPKPNGKQAFFELTKLKFNSLMTDGRREFLMQMGHGV